jgi:hypothetical protein
MRWTGWVLMAAAITVAGSAAGYQPGCASCNGGNTVGPWDAEPCAGPSCYCLAPGCCEEHRHCCDNAWAGYCEHRARVDAFWTSVGEPGKCTCRRPCRQAPMASCSSCAPYPTPAMRPTPALPPQSPTPAADRTP